MVILINNNNEVRTTVKSNLIQYSNNINTITFVIPRLYEGMDMANFMARIQYVLPVSKRIKAGTLTIDSLDYDGLLAKDETSTTVANGTTTTTINENTYMSYVLPVTCDNLTSEGGNVEFTITWYRLEQDEEGNEVTEMVRKCETGLIYVTPGAPWQYAINDELAGIDKIVLQLQELAREYFDIAESVIGDKVVNDIAIDKETGKILLQTLKGTIGEGVAMEDLSNDVGDNIIGKDEDAQGTDGVVHLDDIVE